MSKVYYREDNTEEKEKEVTPQWPFPEFLQFRDGVSDEFREVTSLAGLPTRDLASRPSNGFVRPQVAVSTTVPTLIVAYNPRRKQVKITNITGTQVTWLNTDAGVSATNGDYLGATAGSTFTTDAMQAIWGLSATAAQTVSVYETEYVS